ncbi:hypothetical protein AWW66_00195 [Micromonospora rosaria]|uniref:Uncharacterized protein n=1 Tax=Micromonospora rosaria TaxID=47874 RepID=A0A136PZP4_9ACTN|nr:hypothetical protein [Micromonospora rosaria]KXK63912.1 hypothetical protein AWW66_00195 [Micromonospora rosaria]
MRFDMGSQALPELINRTDGAHQDLGALIRQLVAAAEPLEGRFNGAGKAAFDRFKHRADEIAVDLNSAVASILGGQQGMNASFVEGDQTMSDTTQRAESAANVEGATFRLRS